MANHSAMKLGRGKRPKEAKFPKLASYQCKPLPPPPASWDGSVNCSFPMFLNDQLGDCTIAGIAHQLHMQAAAEGRSEQFTDQEVRDYYFSLSRGHDSGLCEVNVLDYVRDHGFPLSGAHKLKAWASIDHNDHNQVKSCAVLFVGEYMGAELPVIAQEQDEWDAVGHMNGNAAPGSWGGHCMIVSGFDARGVTFITWGKKKRATWAWWNAYVDECYVWLDEDRASIAGIDWSALCQDLQIAGGACVQPDPLQPTPPDLPVPPELEPAYPANQEDDPEIPPQIDAGSDDFGADDQDKSVEP